jgi:hypothetical protein
MPMNAVVAGLNGRHAFGDRRHETDVHMAADFAVGTHYLIARMQEVVQTGRNSRYICGAAALGSMPCLVHSNSCCPNASSIFAICMLRAG